MSILEALFPGATYHPQNNDSLNQTDALIEAGQAIYPAKLPLLEPVYLKTIDHIHSSFRSLIINIDGAVYLSEYSTAKLIENYGKQRGFHFKSWELMCQQEEAFDKALIPYVHGQQIFIQVPIRYQRQRDWLNINACKDLLIVPYKNRVKSLAVQLEKFSLILDYRVGKMIEEIQIAQALTTAWTTVTQRSLQLANYVYEIQDQPAFNRIWLQRRDFMSNYNPRLMEEVVEQFMVFQPVFDILSDQYHPSSQIILNLLENYFSARPLKVDWLEMRVDSDSEE